MASDTDSRSDIAAFGKKEVLMKELSQTMYDLKDAVWKHRERILLEDDMGAKYEIYMAKVIGAATDDPGVILKIAPVR